MIDSMRRFGVKADYLLFDSGSVGWHVGIDEYFFFFFFCAASQRMALGEEG